MVIFGLCGSLGGGLRSRWGTGRTPVKGTSMQKTIWC